jgi:hypothetical protein
VTLRYFARHMTFVESAERLDRVPAENKSLTPTSLLSAERLPRVNIGLVQGTAVTSCVACPQDTPGVAGDAAPEKSSRSADGHCA